MNDGIIEPQQKGYITPGFPHPSGYCSIALVDWLQRQVLQHTKLPVTSGKPDSKTASIGSDKLVWQVDLCSSSSDVLNLEVECDYNLLGVAIRVRCLEDSLKLSTR